jgi:hypothetical protein
MAIDPATTFFDKLKQKLEYYGPVPFIEKKDGSIEVPSTGEVGFSVSASVGDHGISVGYERWHWHEDFETDDEAVNCFMSGVFGEARLAVTRRGNFAHSWTVEILDDGRWVPFTTTAYFLFPFWRKATVHYLRNDRTPSHTPE